MNRKVQQIKTIQMDNKRVLDEIESMFYNQTSYPISSHLIENMIRTLTKVCKQQEEHIEWLHQELSIKQIADDSAGK